MAQQLPCDICNAEPAVQMLTNMETGDTMTLGASCLPRFYGDSLAVLIVAGAHTGPPSKCQCCRRIHEYITTPGGPAVPPEQLLAGASEQTGNDPDPVVPA